MYFVYLICSTIVPGKKYIGFTQNVVARLAKHNEGGGVHTARYKPWELVMYCAFTHKEKALAFERYLKVGSGSAFAKKHLW